MPASRRCSTRACSGQTARWCASEGYTCCWAPTQCWRGASTAARGLLFPPARCALPHACILFLYLGQYLYISLPRYPPLSHAHVVVLLIFAGGGEAAASVQLHHPEHLAAPRQQDQALQGRAQGRASSRQVCTLHLISAAATDRGGSCCTSSHEALPSSVHPHTVVSALHYRFLQASPHPSLPSSLNPAPNLIADCPPQTLPPEQVHR